jgi:hypothetical protein
LLALINKIVYKLQGKKRREKDERMSSKG